MILWYWEQVGGTLCTEFQVVERTPTTARRLVDALIIPDGPKEERSWREVSIAGKDVIVVQAKANRLGMYLMGQGVFSAELVRRLGPRSVKSVVLCGKDDAVMRLMFESYPDHQVVLAPEHLISPTRGRKTVRAG